MGINNKKNKKPVLMHYTSLINTFKILCEGKIKFSSALESNDSYEKELLEANIGDGNDINLLFFSTSNIKRITGAMWLSYCSRRDGACIKFVFKDGYGYKDLFKESFIEVVDMEYVKNYREKCVEEKYFGRCKCKKFNFENEIRYYYIKDNNGDDIKKYAKDNKYCINYEALEKIIVYVQKSNYKITQTFFKNNKKGIDIDVAVFDVIC